MCRPVGAEDEGWNFDDDFDHFVDVNKMIGNPNTRRADGALMI
jgi:hypothetical protein